MPMKLLFCLLALLAYSVSCQNTGKLYLVVAYCPTYFTGGGAIVSIDTTTGKWNIETKFKWPSQVSTRAFVVPDQLRFN